MGGLWSVTLTDFVQVFLIVIGMIIAVPFAINYAGGWGNDVSYTHLPAMARPKRGQTLPLRAVQFLVHVSPPAYNPF